jgi:lysophosphatidate acyltransferase
VVLSNTVFIDRASHKSAIAAFDNAVKHIREDRQSVFIFPEGTRSYYDKPDLLPFKKGAFHLAVKAQVPIVPVVCANYSYILNLRRQIFNSGRIPVKALKKIETKGMGPDDVEDLMKFVREKMLIALRELSEETKQYNGGVAVPMKAT